ncbi:hypothetical protein BG005_000384 [Podila minutissima]|nr:hypothetical protein BG005_000384 [Podila minutissima]
MTPARLTLQSTRLLSSGAKIPLIGLGTYLIEPGKQTEDAVLRALHAGYRHIDTASLYRNEASVGNAIRQRLLLYNKSAAQVLIRWSLQRGHVVLPKSIHKERIEQNADVYDFELSEEDVKILDHLNDNFVSGWDPTVSK